MLNDGVVVSHDLQELKGRLCTLAGGGVRFRRLGGAEESAGGGERKLDYRRTKLRSRGGEGRNLIDLSFLSAIAVSRKFALP